MADLNMLIWILTRSIFIIKQRISVTGRGDEHLGRGGRGDEHLGRGDPGDEHLDRGHRGD